jgi:hypothetical protein
MGKIKKTQPVKAYLGETLQRRIYELYMHPSRKGGHNPPILNDTHLKSIVLHYLDKRIFKCNGRVLFRDDVNMVWIQNKADVVAALQIFIEGQNFKRLNAKDHLVDYFRSIGEMNVMANIIYNYREIPENDDLDNYILRHSRCKINYVDGWTYHMNFCEFRPTRTQDFYYCNTKTKRPFYSKNKTNQLFTEIQKVFGENTGLFLAHFSRIMAGEAFIDKLLTLVTGPRHSSKGTVLSMFQIAFGQYCSCGPMNFFLCHQNDKLTDADNLNKYIASISGISTCRLCYSTEMSSKDSDCQSKVYNPIVLNGSYSRSLNNGGDQIAIRKLYQDTFMGLQVACLVLQSNCLYGTNPAIASDTCVFIRTQGRFLNQFDYDSVMEKGGEESKHVYLRNPSFRAELETNKLPEQLVFLLAEYYNNQPIKFPKNFFFRNEKRERSSVFFDVLRKFITPEVGALTPAWSLRLVTEKFKAFLPQKISPHGLLQLLYPAINFPSAKKSAIGPKGARETLSCRIDLRLNNDLFKIDALNEINLLSDTMEENEDLRASAENNLTQVDCTNPKRLTPYAKLRIVPKFHRSPEEPCGGKRNLFGDF